MESVLAQPRAVPPAPAQTARELAGPAWRPLLWMLWLVSLTAGLIGIWQRMTLGHLPAGYGSYVPWGLWIALYFHGVGMAGGVFVIAGLGYLYGWKGFRRPQALRLAIVLSAACILPAFAAVYFDLGHMSRAHRIFTSPNFRSMMAFNAWMYGAFLIIAGIIWVRSFRSDLIARPLVWAGVILSIMFPSQSGAFFGVVTAKPFWHSPLLPMLFLTSAITAGAALLLVTRYLVSRAVAPEPDEALALLRHITIGGLMLYLVLEFAEFSIGMWNPGSHDPALDLILRGPYWWVFWLVHLLIGVVAALALLWRGNSPTLRAIGALLIAVTFVSSRLNVLVPGQAVEQIRGLQNAFAHPRLQYIYHPTMMEYLVGFFFLALGLTVFYLGWKITCRLAERSKLIALEVQ